MDTFCAVIMNDIFKKKKKYIVFILFQEMLNLYIMDQKRYDISYLGPKMWTLEPENNKDSENIISFKAKVKFWKPESCPCRLCKVYSPQIGFTWQEIWSKFHFKARELERFDYFMLFMKTADNQTADNQTDVLDVNVNWLFCLRLLDVGVRFGQRYSRIFFTSFEI